MNTNRIIRGALARRFRLSVVATDASGNASAALRVRFRIRAGA
jgi:hypothetical protein